MLTTHSFYKEEVTGETKNYVNSKAKSEKKSAMAAMREIVADTAQRYLSVTSLLVTKEPYYRAWNEFVMGYVAMHVRNDRYMFADIGLNEGFVYK
jgi:hypothetical protein